MWLLQVLAFVLFAPLLGGLICGADRIISARMQGRFGPPILQPFYDFIKLMHKENLYVRQSQNIYIWFYLVFVIFTGALFFAGGDFLLFIFSLTLAGIFFVLAGYKGSSPFSQIGAERELIQMMAYEPMMLLAAVGFYLTTGSFRVDQLWAYPEPLLFPLAGIFAGLFYILTIKLRKSPYDLSTSHHGHQEIVKGITTEFTGPTLALIELAHWYEAVFIMGLVYLFWATNPLMGIAIAAITYFLEILIDNTFARAKWQRTLFSAWAISFILGFGNLIFLVMR